MLRECAIFPFKKQVCVLRIVPLQHHLRIVQQSSLVGPTQYTFVFISYILKTTIHSAIFSANLNWNY
jgi:hypothetical protein